MPGVEIETVTLDENSGHPLDAVLEKVDRSKTGPLMIVGLERSNPSSAKERPILYALNMSRPEWPKQLPRPIVFWVPEYLLGLMGREAPDFLDWRSDTLFFPESFGESLLPLNSEAWLGGLHESMPGRQRQARINELKSRLASYFDPGDRVVLAARSEWLSELGTLFSRQGEWNAARESYLSALEIERKLGREDRIANRLGDLGLVSNALGKVDEAENALQAVLAIHRELGDRRAEANGLANLANLHAASERFESAEQFGREALALAEELKDRYLIAYLYSTLLGIMLSKQDLQAAKRIGEKALAAAMDTVSLSRRSEILRHLGILALLEGDTGRAEQHLKEALEIVRMLGEPTGTARTLGALGLLYNRQEDGASARTVLTEAERIFRELGDLAAAARVQTLLED